MPQYGFGSGLMFGVRSDIANATPRLFGTLQEGSVDFSGDPKLHTSDRDGQAIAVVPIHIIVPNPL